ncbi:MAG TPA: class I SAM-dependent methyltransferase [Solirubrobacteraceae bacterium]
MPPPSSSWASTLKELARRLAKPVTSPLDGRVGDINRRVADTRATVEQRTASLEQAAAHGRHALAAYADSVAAYARAATETNSFLGVELRRLDEAVRASVDSATAAAASAERAAAAGEAARAAAVEASNDGLGSRVARAAESPLDQVEAPLAQLIDLANGHTGYAAQADLWFMPPVLVQVGGGEARLSLVNERIVEVPFAMGALSRLAPAARIVDVGSTESTFALSAASLGFRVTAIDPRPLRYAHPNLETVRGRFEDWDPPADERFDAVFLISTVEHIGVGAYGQEAYGGTAIGEGADRAMVERVGELLAPGGLLVLTTPVGTPDIDEFERTYDSESLDRLLAGFEVLERCLATQTDQLTWVSGAGPGPGERGVAMVIATPATA